MKVFWWQGGLHLQPDDEKESEALGTLAESLNFINIDHSIPRGPSVNRGNENSVIVMHELS
jgi:hypothetical protein